MGADVAAEEQFGPYLVYERLGVGGMATVHRALERGIEGFERVVALKRLLPHLAADAKFIKSFVREARVASALNHVNIVQIFKLGRVGTQYFISMEYIDGRDLRRVLRHARKVSGPPPIQVTVGLVLQLCEALDYAHHKLDEDGAPMGLVHRDVSPSNVLVTSNGQIKVIDFGIAKAQSAQLRTQTGRVKGKLAYMAPEALAGKDLDARSDLFAVGVIAHELLTARPLFAAKNEYQTLMKVQRGEVVAPSAFNRQCPPELDAMVLRALARDADDRFHGAGELRDALFALRKQYGLATSERDVAAWLDWAFSLEAPAAFSGNTENMSEAEAAGLTDKAKQRLSRRKIDDEEAAVDLAWGGHDDNANGEPIVLDDVPDVSTRHVAADTGDPDERRATEGDVRLDLDDFADDIPTPLPSHGRPTVDLQARTTTTPMSPRRARSKQPSTGNAIPTALAEGSERSEPSVPGIPIPSRVRTVTLAPRNIPAPPLPPRGIPAVPLPPREAPAASVPPRSIAAATLPPRIPASEQSRGIPLPMAPSRSGPVTSDLSRGTPTATPPARTAAREPSQGVPASARSYAGPLPGAAPRPAPNDRSYAGPLPSGSPHPTPNDRSYAGPLPSDPHAAARAAAAAGVDPSRARTMQMPPPTRLAAPAQPPRTLPTASTAPRTRRNTAPGTGAIGAGTAPVPNAATAQSPRRNLPSDLSATERTPAFTAEDLALAADTMPSIPALQGSEPPTTPEAPPLADPEPETPEPDTTDTGSTMRRATAVPPATSLFPESPDTGDGDELPDGASILTTVPAQRAHAAIPTPVESPYDRRRVLLGRIAIAIAALLLISAATAAAALYLTREPEASEVIAPAPPTTPGKAAGTIDFEITPADASIAISGAPVHSGSPWRIDLAPGVYQIEIAHDGYLRWLTSIDLAAGQRQSVKISLVVAPATTPAAPAAPTPETTGSAAVGSGPGGAAPLADEPVTTTPSSAQTPAAPPTIPSGLVTRTSGALPKVTPPAGVELPPAISSQLCIDDAGHVTSAQIITPLDGELAEQIVATLRTWQYTPYQVRGVTQPACFAITFHAK